MEKITTVAGLKSAIRDLEYKQSCEWGLLKERFHTTCDSLKPVNIIKTNLEKMILAPGLKKSILNSSIGFAAGLIAKTVVVGKTHNSFKKLLGLIVEMVVASKVAKNADEIKAIGNIILKKMTNQPIDPEKV
ncbi:MAG TPA: hypothetical protein VNY73_06935 [Bacteroidia bacterium]|jgi:hypothetical protein|nr:hypothetical protein [Bacteroidia bacterium]